MFLIDSSWGPARSGSSGRSRASARFSWVTTTACETNWTARGQRWD